ncbi:MAG: site-specific DNA-methyltransferase, partial [Gammaproteobacteria bacterium]
MKPNIKSRTVYLGDNLPFLRGINSTCVDLIYADPPFNKKKQFTAPIGSQAEGASFLDLFAKEDIKDEWLEEFRQENYELHSFLSGIKTVGNSYNYCYLVYMAVRLVECHRILKKTGSLYLHCDHTMSHYLKLLLDCIFGENNFRNEIVWCYHAGGASKRRFPRKHHVLLLHGKDAKKSVHNVLRIPYRDLYAYQENHDPAMGVYHPEGKMLHDWWEISVISSKAKERTGWPTQKPLALLEQVILASSNPGDLVLDPFCGCATTCVAAERLEREWVGIDVAKEAWNQIEKRLKKE